MKTKKILIDMNYRPVECGYEVKILIITYKIQL